MTVTIAECRTFSLALPETTEEPHHHMSSFRVRGKIFATVPPGDELLHVFVDDERRELALAMDPAAYENLLWGKKIAGLRVTLAHAERADVEDLLQSAWSRKAPKRLAAQL